MRFQTVNYQDQNLVDPPATNELIVGRQAGLVDVDHILEPNALGVKDLQKAKRRGYLSNQNEDREAEYNDTALAEFPIEPLGQEALLESIRRPFEEQSPSWDKDTICRLFRPLFHAFGG